MHKIDLTKGAVLEKGCVYLIPIEESLKLPADLSAIAIGAGIKNSSIIKTHEQLLLLSSNINVIKELTFSQIKINNEEGPLVLPIREGAYIKSRFRKALLGKNALLE